MELQEDFTSFFPMPHPILKKESVLPGEGNPFPSGHWTYSLAHPGKYTRRVYDINSEIEVENVIERNQSYLFTKY